MTCIIGLVEDGKVYMGADSLVTVGWGHDQDRVGKMFFVNNSSLLIGTSGPSRIGDVLQYGLKIEKKREGQPITDYMVNVVIEAIRTRLKECGITTLDKNTEEYGGSLLVGCYGNLYRVAQTYAITIHEYWAIGAGDDYALGAMAALDSLPPQERITKALQISARFSHLVKPPFNVEVLE